MTKIIDMVGKRIGSLVVIKEDRRNKRGEVFWLCKCDCGRTSIVNGCNLRNEGTKSCGCMQHVRTHGMSKTRTYFIWFDMKRRCLDKNRCYYKYYGGRGITVCDEWLDFENFYRDMGDRPPGKSLDRIDNNGNYCKDNCRWATLIEQGNNRSNNHLITIDGVEKTMAQWSRESKVERNTIRRRLDHGWDIKKAVFKKPKR